MLGSPEPDRHQYFKDLGEIINDNGTSLTRSALMASRMMLLQAVLSAPASSPSHLKPVTAHFNWQAAEEKLCVMIQAELKMFFNTDLSLPLHDTCANFYPVAVAIDAAEAVSGLLAKREISWPVKQLEEKANIMISSGMLSGWTLKTFLIQYFLDEMDDGVQTNFGKPCGQPHAYPLGSKWLTSASMEEEREIIIRDIVSATFDALADESKARYLQDLFQALAHESEDTRPCDAIDGGKDGQISAVSYAVDLWKGPCWRTCEMIFD
jgi:hypothetical protein